MLNQMFEIEPKSLELLFLKSWTVISKLHSQTSNQGQMELELDFDLITRANSNECSQNSTEFTEGSPTLRTSGKQNLSGNCQTKVN
jgi:hypothetical protein